MNKPVKKIKPTNRRKDPRKKKPLNRSLRITLSPDRLKRLQKGRRPLRFVKVTPRYLRNLFRASSPLLPIQNGSPLTALLELLFLCVKWCWHNRQKCLIWLQEQWWWVGYNFVIITSWGCAFFMPGDLSYDLVDCTDEILSSHSTPGVFTDLFDHARDIPPFWLLRAFRFSKELAHEFREQVFPTAHCAPAEARSKPEQPQPSKPHAPASKPKVNVEPAFENSWWSFMSPWRYAWPFQKGYFRGIIDARQRARALRTEAERAESAAYWDKYSDGTDRSSYVKGKSKAWDGGPLTPHDLPRDNTGIPNDGTDLYEGSEEYCETADHGHFDENMFDPTNPVAQARRRSPLTEKDYCAAVYDAQNTRDVDALCRRAALFKKQFFEEPWLRGCIAAHDSLSRPDVKETVRKEKLNVLPVRQKNQNLVGQASLEIGFELSRRLVRELEAEDTKWLNRLRQTGLPGADVSADIITLVLREDSLLMHYSAHKIFYSICFPWAAPFMSMEQWLDWRKRTVCHPRRGEDE